MTTEPQDNQLGRLSALRGGPPAPPIPPDPPEPPEVGLLIRNFNAQNSQHEDLWTRILHAVHAARDAVKGKWDAEDLASQARLGYSAIQAENPQRRALRTRQLAIAGLTVLLDAVACNFAAQALGNDQLQTDAWTVLFLAVLAGGEVALDHYRDRNRKVWRAVATGLGGFVAGLGVLRYSYLIAVGADSPLAALAGAALFTAATGMFVAVGYWALRRAETQRAASARRQARRAEKEACASRERLARRRRERDRLIDAYVVRIKACLLQGHSASQLLLIEAALREHLAGKEPGA
jgi:Flp pilus assembly protein protease CpaA